MSDIGTAYVQIVPSAKGISGSISKVLDGEADSAGKSAGSKLASGIGTGLKVAGAAAIAATAAVGKFAASAVEVGKSFDSSMSQVGATMGDKAKTMIEYNGQTMTSLEALTDFAQEMGRSTVFSASESADALNYMALAGYDAETAIGMLPNVLNLASAGAMDLARASDMVTDTQTAFGIDLKRTEQMVNEMAKAASTGNTSVEQLGDAFLTVGGLAQELNGGMITLANGSMQGVDGVQELEIALTAMANAGIKGSEAGTHMRNMLLKLSSPTKDGAKALEEMGVAVFDAEGEMRSLSDIFGDLSTEMDKMTQKEKIQTISDLFNTRDLASAEALLNAVSSDWDKIGAEIVKANEGGVLYQGTMYSMEEAQAKFGDAMKYASDQFQIMGAAERMAWEQTDNLAGDMKALGSAFEGTQLAVSNVLTPSLREFVQFGTEGLSRLTDAFNSGGLEGAMEAFGEILSEGLSMVIERLPDMVNAGMQLLGALAKGLMDNIDVILFAAGDIMEVLFQGLLDATGGENNIIIEIIDWILGAFEENYMKLIDAGLQIILNLISGIGEGLPDIIYYITEIVLHLVDAIIDYAPAFLEAGLEIILGLAQGLIDAIPIIIQRLPEIIQGIVDFIIQAIPMLIDAAMQLTMGIIDALPQIIDAIVVALPQIIEAVVNGLMEGLPMLIEGLVQLHIMIAQHLPEIAMALIEAIPQIIQSIIEIIINSIPAWLNAIQSIVTSIGTLLSTEGSSFLSRIGQFFSNLLNNVVQWLQQLPPKAAYFAGQTVARFISFLASLPGKAMALFNNVLSNVKNFGTKMITEGPRIAREFGEKLVQKLKELPGKVLEIGSEIVNGLKEGISKAWTALTDWVSDLCKNLIKGFKDNLKIGSPSKVFADEIGRWIPEGIAVGMESNQSVLESAVNSMTMNLVPYDPVGNSIDKLGNTLNDADRNVSVYVTLEGDANRLFRVMQRKATSNYRLTGSSSMVTV